MKKGILLLSCPDCPGIIAAVSQFLYSHGANIIHADEHKDSECNLFFMRVEWDMEHFGLTHRQFEEYFNPIALRYRMDWYFKLHNDSSRVAILVSKEDHCLVELLYRHYKNQLQCSIELVISNHLEAKELTSRFHVPYFYIPVNSNNKTESEAKILRLLKKHKVDFIILARYMQILSPRFVQEFPNKIINIHHSFLPAFIGTKPYHQAYNRGVKIIGATSHYVTESLDKGPIIEQDILRISHRDDVEDLIRKGRDLEKTVLSRAVQWHCENRILIYRNKTVIFS